MDPGLCEWTHCIDAPELSSQDYHRFKFNGLVRSHYVNDENDISFRTRFYNGKTYEPSDTLVEFGRHVYYLCDHGYRAPSDLCNEKHHQEVTCHEPSPHNDEYRWEEPDWEQCEHKSEKNEYAFTHVTEYYLELFPSVHLKVTWIPPNVIRLKLLRPQRHQLLQVLHHQEARQPQAQ